MDLVYDDPEGFAGFWDDPAPVLKTCREDLVLTATGVGGPDTAAT